MTATDIAIVATIVLGYAMFSGTLSGRAVSAPLIFVAAGALLGPDGLAIVDVQADSNVIELLLEVTLALVLFSDASRIDLRLLRLDHGLPVRMLAIGLPLTIGLGLVAAVVLFGEFSVVEAALLATMLAPTDAALGQAVVTTPAVPVRVRNAINVESGLNDGIVFPAATILIATVAAEHSSSSVEWIRFAAEQIGYGAALGATAGCVGAALIDRSASRGWMSDAIRPIATLAIAALAATASAAVGGNAFIAAFVAGLAFGSIARSRCDTILEFTEEEGEVLTLVTFFLFGSLIAGPRIDELTWQVALYALASLTIVRMLPVAVSLAGTGVGRVSAAFLGWFGPRGLASILLALIVEAEGVPLADELLLITTWTVLASVLLHGVTAAPFARRYASFLERSEDADMPEMGDAPAQQYRVSMLGEPKRRRRRLRQG